LTLTIFSEDSFFMVRPFMLVGPSCGYDPDNDFVPFVVGVRHKQQQYATFGIDHQPYFGRIRMSAMNVATLLPSAAVTRSDDLASMGIIPRSLTLKILHLKVEYQGGTKR
jgi:hypothetical protein